MPEGITGGQDDAHTPGADTDENTTAPSSGQGEQPDTSDAPARPASMEEAIEAALTADPTPPADLSAASDDPDDDDPDADAPDGADDPDAETPDADADKGGDKPTDVKAKGDKPGDPEPDEPGTTAEEDPSDDELAAMRPGPRRRIVKLLSQRNAARQEAEAAQADASSYQSLRSYMAENRLQDQEVADLFRAGAALKSGTPEGLNRFLSQVEPLVQQAREALGHAIPADLQTQVDDGEMTEAAARQFAQTRYNANRANAQVTEQQQAQQAQMARQAATAISQAVNSHVSTLAASDPDFDRKRDVMLRVSQAMVAERGRPTNQAAAIQMVDAAWAETNRLVGAAAPKPKATRPTPSSGTSSNRTGVQPAPTSLEDVINSALG